MLVKREKGISPNIDIRGAFEKLLCMPRTARIAPGDTIFHVLNRANVRARIFENSRDYQALERVIAETTQRVSMRILVYCTMLNHWHVVLWPQRDGDLGAFI